MSHPSMFADFQREQYACVFLWQFFLMADRAYAQVSGTTWEHFLLRYILLAKVGFLTFFESWTLSNSRNNVVKYIKKYIVAQKEPTMLKYSYNSQELVAGLIIHFKTSCKQKCNFEMLATTVIWYKNIVAFSWWPNYYRYVHTIVVVAYYHNGRKYGISVSLY